MANRTIYDVHDRVLDILVADPETRNSDEKLYIEYVKAVNPDALQSSALSFYLNRRLLKLPSIESVGRCRRKIQSDYPELRSSKVIKDARYEKWKEMREYAQK